jgi:hypothetical protein
MEAICSSETSGYIPDDITLYRNSARRDSFRDRDKTDRRQSVSGSLRDVTSGNQYHYNFTDKNCHYKLYIMIKDTRSSVCEGLVSVTQVASDNTTKSSHTEDRRTSTPSP